MARRVTTSPFDPEAVGELVRAASSDGPSAAVRLAQREQLVRSTAIETDGRAWGRWGVAIGSVLAAAAIAFVVIGPRSTPVDEPSALVTPPPQVESEWFAAPLHGAIAVDIGDGSRLQLVDGARGRMTRGAEEARLVLEDGLLQAEVEPSAGRRWTIEAGPYRVRVVGTIFTVDWDPTEGRLDVEVRRGKVEVVGPDGGSPIPVDAGHRLHASLPDATAVLAELEPHSVEAAIELDEAPTIVDDTDADEAAPTRKKKATLEPSPSWQSLARDGRYAEAFAVADAIGLADLSRRSDRDTLELLADTARLAKHPAQATKAYETMRERFAGSAAAARAAFQLGRLAADRGSDPRAAAKWFRTSLAESPRGSFATQARGRLVQALSAAGDRDGARAAARDYLDHHPDGPHAKLARSLLPP